MNRLKRFFHGRNGIDQLSLALLIFGACVLIIAQLIRMPIVGLVNYFCMFLFFYRTLSRDIAKRRYENMKYLMLVQKIKRFIKLRLRIIKEIRSHKYIRCPHCGQRIRVPRKKGRIVITCQRCSLSFGDKS